MPLVGGGGAEEDIRATRQQRHASFKGMPAFGPSAGHATFTLFTSVFFNQERLEIVNEK